MTQDTQSFANPSATAADGGMYSSGMGQTASAADAATAPNQNSLGTLPVPLETLVYDSSRPP